MRLKDVIENPGLTAYMSGHRILKVEGPYPTRWGRWTGQGYDVTVELEAGLTHVYKGIGELLSVSDRPNSSPNLQRGECD